MEARERVRVTAHLERGDERVERVFARGRGAHELTLLSFGEAREVRRARGRVRLRHGPGEETRVDLECQRQTRALERPDREARVAQREQFGHAADGARADGSRAADLEHGLRRDAACREPFALRPPVLRTISDVFRSLARGPAPERRSAFREPAFTVSAHVCPEREDVGGSAFAHEPRWEREREVEARDELRVVARSRGEVLGPFAA